MQTIYRILVRLGVVAAIPSALWFVAGVVGTQPRDNIDPLELSAVLAIFPAAVWLLAWIVKPRMID